MPSSREQLVESYEEARAFSWQHEHRKLSAKEYLDTVDPSGHRSVKSARDYMRRVIKGERPGTRIVKRSVVKSDSGDTFQVVYKDNSSANVILPKGQSRLGLWRKTTIKKAVAASNKVAQNRWDRNYRKFVGFKRTKRGKKVAQYKPVQELEQAPKHYTVGRVRGIRYNPAPKASGEALDV